MYNQIEDILKQKNNIRLKIFALEYIIEKNNEKYIMYAEAYSNRKKEYNSLKELFDNFTIYNEPINQSLDRIKIVG